MSDGTALHAAILRAPRDDTVRLAYADWLDENGEHERAEFVRVQCELHRRWYPKRCHGCQVRRGKESARRWRAGITAFGVAREEAPCRVCGNLFARERELSDAHEADWDSEAHDAIGWPHHHYQLNLHRVRGFIADVTCSAADFVTHGDSIRAAHPVERVCLTTVPAVVGILDDGTGNISALWTLSEEWTRDGCELMFDTLTGVCAELRRRWNGITFELPSPPPAAGVAWWEQFATSTAAPTA